MQDPTDKEFLQWLYDRIKNIYHEDSNMDYMRKLKSIIDNTVDQDVGNTMAMIARIDALEWRLRIEARQLAAIRMYTQDAKLACICADHESLINKLLEQENP